MFVCGVCAVSAVCVWEGVCMPCVCVLCGGVHAVLCVCVCRVCVCVVCVCVLCVCMWGYVFVVCVLCV